MARNHYTTHTYYNRQEILCIGLDFTLEICLCILLYKQVLKSCITEKANGIFLEALFQRKLSLFRRRHKASMCRS